MKPVENFVMAEGIVVIIPNSMGGRFHSINSCDDRVVANLVVCENGKMHFPQAQENDGTFKLSLPHDVEAGDQIRVSRIDQLGAYAERVS